jgi:hypothetical protein
MIIFGVILHQQVQRGFVFFDLREAPDSGMEAVIDIVVVDRRDFSNQNAFAHPPELVVASLR